MKKMIKIKVHDSAPDENGKRKMLLKRSVGVANIGNTELELSTDWNSNCLMVNVKNSTKTYIIMFEDFIRTLDEMGVLK
jgi:hypothetical protein